jgi:hypothetical protein
MEQLIAYRQRLLERCRFHDDGHLEQAKEAAGYFCG